MRPISHWSRRLGALNGSGHSCWKPWRADPCTLIWRLRASRNRPVSERFCLKWLRRIVLALVTIVALGLTVWTAAAIYFDSPLGVFRTIAALLYLIVILGAMLFLRRHASGLLIAIGGFVLVALWWFSLKPSNQRNWQPDNAETAYADINGDQITIHNFRNCDYQTEQDYTCHWETRSYNLANLRDADIFITWWGSPWIAHPIVSFDFGDQGHVAMSIETRDVVGQGYSAIRGFFRQYALTYIATDERDVIRLRTNYRKDEEVYIFRTTAPPALARKLFLDYLQRVNELHANPEWYNAITNNCTTNIAVSAAAAQDVRTRLGLAHPAQRQDGRDDVRASRPGHRWTDSARIAGAGAHQSRGESCRQQPRLFSTDSCGPRGLRGKTRGYLQFEPVKEARRGPEGTH